MEIVVVAIRQQNIPPHFPAGIARFPHVRYLKPMLRELVYLDRGFHQSPIISTLTGSLFISRLPSGSASHVMKTGRSGLFFQRPSAWYFPVLSISRIPLMW